MFTFERAGKADVAAIQAFLLENYFPESVYSGVFDYDAAATAQYISGWTDEICVIAYDGEQIVGVFAMYLARTYYRQPEADIILFYVAPSHRGTGLSREMVQLIVGIADKAGARAIYTDSASGMECKNNALYTNLFKKFGFQVLGTELARFNNV